MFFSAKRQLPGPDDTIVHAQMRDDPRVEQAALDVTADDRVLVVTSGGCTALTLLAAGPAELTAVDINPAQTHLLQLKLRAIRTLSLEDCRRLMGVWPDGDRVALYRKVARGLPSDTRAFWDAHTDRVVEGLLTCGEVERICRTWVRRMVVGGVHPPRLYEQLLRLDDPAAQRRFYRKRWDTWRWRAALQLVVRSPLIDRLVPPRLHRRLKPRDLVREIRTRMERAFCQFPARDNYLLTQFLTGRFPTCGDDGMPPYLRPAGFEAVRRHAHRLRPVTAHLARMLERRSPGTYHKVSLSDLAEWMPEAEVRPLAGAVDAALAPGGLVLHRHILEQTRVPHGPELSEDTDAGLRLTELERSFLYRRVSLFRKSDPTPAAPAHDRD